MEIMTDLNSRLLVSQQSRNSKKIKNSPAVSDFPTGCIINDKTEIHKLNDDCLMQIFTYIPRGNRFLLEKVCRRWEIVSRRSWHTFKKFDLKNNTWGDDSVCENLRHLKVITLKKILFRCGSFLTHIDFSRRYGHWEELTGKVVSVFAKYCTNLQYVDFENSDPDLIYDDVIDDGHLSKLFLNNKKLRYVKLELIRINGKCLLNLSADYLETLIIIGCHDLSSCNIKKAVNKFQKLHTLTLSFCKALTSKTFNTVCFRAKSLKEFEFRDYSKRPIPIGRTLFHIEEFINLEILDIQSNNLINDAALKVIGEKCRELKRVNLSNDFSISNKGLANIVSLPKLEDLDISCLDITDDIFPNMPNLRKLKCTCCRELKNQGLCRLIKKSHNLEILDVSDCRRVSNKLVQVAIEATKNRTNNLTLEIYVSKTGIDIDRITTATSPFLRLSTERIFIFQNYYTQSSW